MGRDDGINLGVDKDDGHLIEADNYHDVVAVFDIVQKDELSKRKAARRLDTSRATINRSLTVQNSTASNPVMGRRLRGSEPH